MSRPWVCTKGFHLQASIVHHGLSRCSFSLGAASQLKPEFSEQNKMFFETQHHQHLSRTFMIWWYSTWCSLPNMCWKRLQSFRVKTLEDSATFRIYMIYSEFHRIPRFPAGMGSPCECSADFFEFQLELTHECERAGEPRSKYIVLKCHTHEKTWMKC
jgi:hypothetical protein